MRESCGVSRCGSVLATWTWFTGLTSRRDRAAYSTAPARMVGLKGPSSEPRGVGSLATQIPRGPIMGKDSGDLEIERHGLCPQRASSLVLATDSWATFMAGFGWSIPYPKGHIGDSRNARNEGHVHCADSCSFGPALPHGPTHPPLSQAHSSAVSQHSCPLRAYIQEGAHWH